MHLLSNIRDKSKPLVKRYMKELDISDDIKLPHPLDQDVLIELDKISIRDEDDDYRIFHFLDNVNSLWKLLIEKSIKCLRYFDSREPFMENSAKKPIAYGVNELSQYFDKYSKFESMLYGGSKYYRDHVVHVFRTWLLGVDCLLRNDGEYMSRINIGKEVKINPLEKISIWTMISLTHDLGYPLEKAQEIIDNTKDMMKSFIVNPTISMDLSFNGVQNNMNDFVVRFLSSKMHEKLNSDSLEKYYVARLQPKYYFKFQKSLEKSMHGTLSAIIIYKLLLYFLESDYSINEDYSFNKEDVRQFYIRREILRSIASHTCKDIYHLDMLSFAYLLIIVDDAQEWGRKKITELYVKSDIVYELKGISTKFDTAKVIRNGKEVYLHTCTIKERFQFSKKEKDALEQILRDLQKQSDGYSEIFRDGQDTANRNFSFEKECEVVYQDSPSITFHIVFYISNDINSSFTVIQEITGDHTVDSNFNLESMKEIYNDCEVSKDQKDNKVEYYVRNKYV